MKCSKCGKEFGEGVNCQYCGVDRVTGLANYSSYGTSDYQGANTAHDDSSYNSSPKTMVCFACGEIIPSDSEYCPYCRKKLFETCPKCGAKYSSQYRVCNKCGTDRAQYHLKLEAKKQEDRRREREEQDIREAQYLREELPPSVVSLSTILISAWILFCLTPLWPFSGYGNLLVIIGVSILLWGISAMICGAIGESKIKNWKEEHPNDPRSKYL
jgi:uncharacterized membrane protein YvbJ